MNPALPEEAQQFAEAALRAFGSLGAVDAARRAEMQPELRREASAALQALGIDDLDARAGADALAAGAALCEAAGRVVLPYPVAAVLVRDAGGRPFAVVPPTSLRVDHGDLFPEWGVATLDGCARVARPSGAPLGSRLGPFVTDLVPAGAVEEDARRAVATRLALDAWQVLGAVSGALELAVDHVSGRVQFGKPLSAFQVVQFQLADAAVAVAGLRELALFTLWRLDVAGAAALVDVLALRAHALDVATAVLRTCQQLHGAAGVCDEYDISVLCRHVQPLLRLPFGVERTVAALAEAVEREGFDGLFPHGATPA